MVGTGAAAAVGPRASTKACATVDANQTPAPLSAGNSCGCCAGVSRLAAQLEGLSHRLSPREPPSPTWSGRRSHAGKAWSARGASLSTKFWEK